MTGHLLRRVVSHGIVGNVINRDDSYYRHDMSDCVWLLLESHLPGRKVLGMEFGAVDGITKTAGEIVSDS